MGGRRRGKLGLFLRGTGVEAFTLCVCKDWFYLDAEDVLKFVGFLYGGSGFGYFRLLIGFLTDGCKGGFGFLDW